jgi:hypothetical protein
MKPTLILSGKATPPVSGQGLNLHHMIEGLREAFQVTVFCQGGSPSVPTRAVPASRLSRLIGEVPVVRRRRDWQTWFGDTSFETCYMAAHLFPAAVFQGVVGQCAASLVAARKTYAENIRCVSQAPWNQISRGRQ